MGVEFETRELTNTSVVWKVGLPRFHAPVSETFEISGNQWNLQLKTEAFIDSYRIYDEAWIMCLVYSGNKPCPCFNLKLYIRNSGRDCLLEHNKITSTSTSTTIWNCRSSAFRKAYPNIPIVGTALQFVLDFDLVVKDRRIPSSLKVNESVQTTSTATCAEEHICLENLSLDLRKLVEADFDPDVQLKCGDFSMGAHKLILGARSEVFRKMMESDMVEGREGSVEISDMEPEVLERFIKYIYTGILPELTEDTALPLYEAAGKYQVEALKKRSGHFLAENVSPENALEILVTADAHGDTDLKRRLVSYIAEEEVIPDIEAEWLEFCNQYPKLANEVLNYCYKYSSSL